MEDLKGVLQQNHFSFKKQFGQNFITDVNLLRGIVSDAGVDEQTTVVEIGCGAGTLTRALAERAKMVYGFEIDRDLQPVLAETLRGVNNVQLTFGDFMKADLKAFERTSGPYTVVANLPYYITTPLVMRFLEEAEQARGIVVMVQEEVAERFCAQPDTPAYGAITAGIALRGSAKIVRRVPRTLFTPRPNVDSAVVKITFEENRLPVQDAKLYRETVKCAFLNRRKTLENNLMQYFGLDRPAAAQILSQAGVPPKARGETLSPELLALLSNVIGRARQSASDGKRS